MFSDENVQRYVKSLYAVALLLILVPLVDLTLRVMPPQFGTLQWRFATVGLLFGNVGTVILGIGLFGLVAAITGQRNVLRGFAFAVLGLAVVLAAIIVLFGLDAIQIRRLANANFKRAILMSSVGALFTGSAAAVAAAFLGRAALVASRAKRVVERRPVKAPPSVVVSRPAPVESARTSESA